MISGQGQTPEGLTVATQTPGDMRAESSESPGFRLIAAVVCITNIFSLFTRIWTILGYQSLGTRKRAINRNVTAVIYTIAMIVDPWILRVHVNSDQGRLNHRYCPAPGSPSIFPGPLCALCHPGNSRLLLKHQATTFRVEIVRRRGSKTGELRSNPFSS
jgi:hypothetical protein